MNIAVFQWHRVLRHVMDTSHLRPDILDKFSCSLPDLLNLAGLEDLISALVEVLKHLLDIRVQRPMDLMQLSLLLLAQQALQLMEKEVDLACDKLCSFIICKLDSCFIFNGILIFMKVKMSAI